MSTPGTSFPGVVDWNTQAKGQQHTSPLRAGCEARRREIVVGLDLLGLLLGGLYGGEGESNKKYT